MKRLIPILLILIELIVAPQLYAQAPPKAEVTSTEGTEFYVAWLLNGASQLTPEKDPTLQLKLIASARQDMDIRLEHPNGGVDTYSIPANGSVVIDVEPNEVYVDMGADLTETSQRRGIRVYSVDPMQRFTLVSISQNGSNMAGTTSYDGTLLLPIEGLGKEYVIQTYEQDHIANQFLVMGTETNTHVTVSLTNDSKKHKAGSDYSFTIGPKDVWLVTAGAPAYDLSGTTICADKPVVVFNGNQSTLIPNRQGMTDDHAYEQALSVDRWGKEFVVPMPAGNLKDVYVAVTAAYDGTVVNTTGNNTSLFQSQVNLNMGETYRGHMKSGALHIQASEPVMVYLYTTSAGNNSYEPYPEADPLLLGDPSSTIINAIEQFTDTSVITTYVYEDDQTGLSPTLSHYLHLVTKSPGTMTMNGNPVTGWSSIGGVSYVRRQVPAGTYVLANEKGFTGYLMDLDEGQVNIHSVGYDFVPYADSLFITIPDANVMSPYSYSLERMEQGFYQRQLKEWPLGRERLDTAYVCDGTLVGFLGQMDSKQIPEKLEWEIVKLEGKKEKSIVRSQDMRDDQADRDWAYTFRVDPQLDKRPGDRDPFTNYRLDLHIYRNHLLCPDLEADSDTLKTVIHVIRAFNDTVTKVICDDDSLYFFLDKGEQLYPVEDPLPHPYARDYENPENEDSTCFRINALPGNFNIQYKVDEWQYFSRAYESSTGCDSISVLKLYVCRTAHTTIDTVVCENQPLRFTDKFLKTKFDMTPGTDKVYYDTLKTRGCGCLEDVPDFEGCDSIIELHVHVCPVYSDTLKDVYCVNGHFDVPYEWRRDGRVNPDSLVRNIYVTKSDIGKTLEFKDPVKTVSCPDCKDGGCDSIFVLRLTVLGYLHDTLEDHFCDATYDYDKHQKVLNDYTWKGHADRTVWDANNQKHVSGNEIVNMKGGTTNIFVDTVRTDCDTIYALRLTKDTLSLTVTTANIPNNVTYSWHGKTYGPFPDVEEGTVLHFYDDNATNTKAGCDSIERLDLVLSEAFYQEDTWEMCDNQEYTWVKHPCGHLTDTVLKNLPAGKYEIWDKYQTTPRPDKPVPCDSIYKLILTVHPTYERFDTLYICDNQSAVWNGMLFAGSKVTPVAAPYYHFAEGGATVYDDDWTKPTIHGCDSLCHLHIVQRPTYNMPEETAVICADSTFVWEGHSDTSRKLYDLATGMAVQFGKGRLWTNATNQTFVLVDSIRTQTCQDCSPAGCDSIHTLRLTVNPVYGPIVIDTTYCLSKGLPFVWTPDASHPEITREFVRDTTACFDTLKTAGCNCDSIFELRLRIYDDDPKRYDTIVCHNSDPFVMGTTGTIFAPRDSTVGMHQYVKRVYNPEADLCPYVETWNVEVKPYYNGDEDEAYLKEASVCQDSVVNYEWEEHMYNADGSYRTLYDNEGKPLMANEIRIVHVGDYIYRDSLKTKACGDCDMPVLCDSVWVLHLHVDSVYRFDTTIMRCDYDTIHWEGMVIAGNQYEPAPTDPRPDYVFSIGGDNTVSASHTSKAGCDSVRWLKVVLYHGYLDVADEDTTYHHICETDTLHFYGDVYNQQGEWGTEDGVIRREVLYYTDETVHGCDSAVAHVVYIHPTYFLEKGDTICQKSDYSWNDLDLAEQHVYLIKHKLLKDADWTEDNVLVDEISTDDAGWFVYRDSLKTRTCDACPSGVGCDSVWQLTLFVAPSYLIGDERTISSEDTIHWEDRLFIGEDYAGDIPAGVTPVVLHGDSYEDEVAHHAYYGEGEDMYCDSIRTISIKVGKVFRDTTYAFVCDNCTYDWVVVSSITQQPETLMVDLTQQAGETEQYQYEQKTVLGFDSVYYLMLTGMPTYLLEDDDAEICQGVSYIWEQHEQSHTLYQDGKLVTLISTEKEGWTTLVDSLKTQTLFVDPHRPNMPITTLCDSVWTQRLYVKPTYNDKYHAGQTRDVLDLCSNELTVWGDTIYVGYDYDTEAHPIVDRRTIIYITRDMLVNDTLYDQQIHQTARGCDSILYLSLHVSASPFTQLYDTIGDNDEVWHFGHGNNYHEASEFHVSDYSDKTRVPYTRFFIDTVASSTGCDSIIWDSLYVVPSYSFALDTAICSNERFDWRRWTELNHTVSQTIRDTVRSQYGSDEIYVLNLTIIPSFEKRYSHTMCKNDTLDWQHSRIFYEPGDDKYETTFEARYQRSELCDSVYTMHVRFYDYYHFTTEIDTFRDVICQYDDYHWIGADGTEHKDALRDEQGNAWSFVPTDTTGWIVIYDSLHTSAPCHCDSTFVLKLFVKPAFRDYTDTANVICSNDSVYWDQTDRYYKSEWARDIYDTAHYVNQIGCDSNYYFHVRINQMYDSLLVDTVCADEKDYVWQDRSFRQEIELIRAERGESARDTTIRDIRTYSTISQCDSTFRISLTILPLTEEEWDETLCEGETYMLNDQALTKSGTYHDTLVNKWGCKHLQTLHLTVNQATRFVLDVPDACANYSEYVLYYAYDGFAPISYSVTYDSLAREAGFEDVVDEPIVDEEQVLLPMPEAMTELDYVRPGYYTATIAFRNEICQTDSLMTLNYPFAVRYPDWITEQHWNDLIGILVPELNGGYSFRSYQWYRNDTLLIGETKPYLYDPQWLTMGAQYSVMLVRENDSVGIFTCPIVPKVRQDSVMPTMPYVSVVPTYVLRDNPVVNILSITAGTYTLYNAYGHQVECGSFEPGEHNAQTVRLPAVSGVYVFELREQSGIRRSVKVIVN